MIYFTINTQNISSIKQQRIARKALKQNLIEDFIIYFNNIILNMNPDISILVPVYNVSKYIEKCVISLCEQEMDNLEYIYYDDCSPDNSIEILQSIIERYPNRANQTRIIRSDINRGLATARNILVDNANGRYILHVDSDDYIELDCAKTLFKKAEEEKADIVISDIYREKKHETKIQQVQFSPDKTKYINLVLSGLSPSYNCGKLINTQLYNKHHIRCKEGLNVLEDYHTMPRLAYYANKIIKVDKPLYHYIQYNENAYSKNCNEQFINNVCEAIDIIDSFFNSKEDATQYTKSINAAKALTKINNIKHANRQLQKRIINLFPEIKTNGDYKILNLSLIDKLIYLLIQKKLSSLIFVITYVIAYGLNIAIKLKSKMMKILSANN